MEDWKALDCRNNDAMMVFLSDRLSYLERIQNKSRTGNSCRMEKITGLFANGLFINEVRREWLQRASHLQIALPSHPSLAEDSVSTFFE